MLAEKASSIPRISSLCLICLVSLLSPVDCQDTVYQVTLQNQNIIGSKNTLYRNMKLGFSFSSTGSFTNIPPTFPTFFLLKYFRSIETGGCSIYRELLRLHFSDEQSFCEDGILAEVLKNCIKITIDFNYNLWLYDMSSCPLK